MVGLRRVRIDDGWIMIHIQAPEGARHVEAIRRGRGSCALLVRRFAFSIATNNGSRLECTDRAENHSRVWNAS